MDKDKPYFVEIQDIGDNTEFISRFRTRIKKYEQQTGQINIFAGVG